MQINRTYKYKLYESKKNRNLDSLIDLSSWIYNHCIALHNRYYRRYGKYLNVYQLQKHITKLKRQEKFQRWSEVPSQSIQDITQRIDKGFKKFFDDLKKKIKSSPPKFKKRFKYKSFTLKQAGYKFLEGEICIGKRLYKFFNSRKLNGEIKTITIKRFPTGSIYIFLSVTEEISDPEKINSETGKIAGFDFGCETFLWSSDEKDIDMPLFFKKSKKMLVKANRFLSSKKKGSNNRKKARLNLARIHEKVCNRRLDYHFKLANRLTDEYDCLFFETLDLKFMNGHHKKIGDLGFYSFIQIMKYYAHIKGKVVHQIDKWFPSSKTCSSCLYVHKDLGRYEKQWVCPSCGDFHDRNRNASHNIKREGASSLSLEQVITAYASTVCQS